jgi:hypothetical protein
MSMATEEKAGGQSTKKASYVYSLSAVENAAAESYHVQAVATISMGRSTQKKTT